MVVYKLKSNLWNNLWKLKNISQNMSSKKEGRERLHSLNCAPVVSTLNI